MAAGVSLFFALLFLLLTVIGVFGNLIVIIAIAGDTKMRRSVMNILLLNLAVADLSNMVLAASDWVPPVIFGSHSWMLPAILCPICRYMECVFLFASISTQLIVCVERYIAIVLPMQARQLCCRRNAVITILIAWLFCGMFAAPYALGHTIKLGRSGEWACRNTWLRGRYWMEFKWAEFLLFYLIPCIVIIAVYSKIATVLWAQNPRLQETTCLNGNKTAQSENLRMRRSVVNMLIACTSVYFLCYSPIQAIFLSKSVFNVSIHPPYSFVLLMNALAMTCSASNPLLYTLFSTKFRRRLKRVVADVCIFAKLRDVTTLDYERKTFYTEYVSKEVKSTL